MKLKQIIAVTGIGVSLAIPLCFHSRGTTDSRIDSIDPAQLVHTVVISEQDRLARLLEHQLREKQAKYQAIVDRTGLSIEAIETIQSECDRRAVPEWLVYGLIETESFFNPNLECYNEWNRTYDRGLMQVNSGTAPGLWKRVFPDQPYQVQMQFDPVTNILLGMEELGDLISRYRTKEEALTAYNMGPTGLRRYVANRGTASSRYSRRVLEKGAKYR